MMEAATGSTPTTEYIYLGDRLVAQYAIAANKVYSVHTDRIGSPFLVTNKLKATQWTATYQPYGATQTTTNPGTITQNVRLPGMQQDAEFGNIHNGFRDYNAGASTNPMQGHYPQADLIGLAGGLNPYRYVNSNPLRYIDPQGLVDAQFTFPWDPTIPEDATYNPPQYYTYGAHGDDENHNLAYPTPDSSTGYSVSYVGDYILSHGWDRHKPIQALQCYAARGGDNSFIDQLSQYLANQIHGSVTVIGGYGEVRSERWKIGNFYFGGADPVDGGWKTVTKSPN